MNRSIFFILPLLVTLLAASPGQAVIRTWTNTAGTTIEAEYVSATADMVTIKRSSDGLNFPIAIATLSAADQAWLERQAKAEAAGDGLYIAAGHGGHRMSSLDGITWTNHEFWDKPAHNQNDLKAIAAGNGICVVVGGFSKSNILSTTDGVEWHRNEFNMGVLSGVVFVEDRFLAFGEGGKVADSSDGMSWKIIGDAKVREHLIAEAQEQGLDGPLKSNIRRWAHAGGLFVGSGDSGFLITTRDFESWSYPTRIDPQSRRDRSDTQMLGMARDPSGEAERRWRAAFSVRRRGFWPLATWLALMLATPMSMTSRLRGLAVGAIALPPPTLTLPKRGDAEL